MTVTIIDTRTDTDRDTKLDNLSDSLSRPLRGSGVVTDYLARQTSEHDIAAQKLRVGCQVLTDDGWQTIQGLLVFQEPEQVTVYTDERDDLMTDGWRFELDQTVMTRKVPTQEQAYQQRLRERRERKRLRRLAMAAAECPDWCIEHYDAGERQEQRNHTGDVHTVEVRNAYTDATGGELGFWLEKRYDQENGEHESVVVLEVRLFTENLELTPENARLFASKVMSLADRAALTR